MIIREIQKLVITSNMQEMIKVETFIDELCSYFNVNNDYFANITLAVTEAVENAIKHGNQNDPSKLIQISFYTNGGYLCFKVEDEGYGFDSSLIKDPTDPSNENDTAGRGIYLMQALTDKMQFIDNGSAVELCFASSAIHRQLADMRIRVYREYLSSVTITQEFNN